MPVIHAPLSDEDFVDLSIMAREKGMTRSALAAHILTVAIHKAAKNTPDEANVAINRQGLPLAKKLKEIQTMTVDGTPMVTMYERQ